MNRSLKLKFYTRIYKPYTDIGTCTYIQQHNVQMNEHQYKKLFVGGFDSSFRVQATFQARERQRRRHECTHSCIVDIAQASRSGPRSVQNPPLPCTRATAFIIPFITFTGPPTSSISTPQRNHWSTPYPTTSNRNAYLPLPVTTLPFLSRH